MKRREFLGLSAISAIQLFALVGSPGRASGAGAPRRKAGFGPLVFGRGGLIDLPAGFSYSAVQRGGQLMSDGYAAAPQPDGMAAFNGAKGTYILLRNQELGDTSFMNRYGYAVPNAGKGGIKGPRFSEEKHGGVTRVVVDKATLLRELAAGNTNESKSVTDSRWILAGTDKNCSGGVMSGGWVTCEESSDAGHGYALLTKTTDDRLMAPRPIRSWGRMHREGVCLDPATGCVYMTEDRGDGCFYRHVPERVDQPMGGGRVEAMVVEELPTMDPYPMPEPGKLIPSRWARGTEFKVTWRTIPDPQAAKETCRSQGQGLGCTTFNRNEGIIWDNDSVWFISSLGGPRKGGQIFQYIPSRKDPSKGTLVLQLEVTDQTILSCPDNLIMSPWGDVIMGEDNYVLAEGVRHQFVRGLTPSGEVYDLARNPQESPAGSNRPGAEFTGLCFSPDGEVLFVNLQSPMNITFAIRGPWPAVT